MCSLEVDELDAEAIYKLVRLGVIDKELFIYMAKSLYSRSKFAGHYLKFLILNKPKLIGGLNEEALVAPQRKQWSPCDYIIEFPSGKINIF